MDGYIFIIFCYFFYKCLLWASLIKDEEEEGKEDGKSEKSERKDKKSEKKD